MATENCVQPLLCLHLQIPESYPTNFALRAGLTVGYQNLSGHVGAPAATEVSLSLWGCAVHPENESTSGNATLDGSTRISESHQGGVCMDFYQANLF